MTKRRSRAPVLLLSLLAVLGCSKGKGGETAAPHRNWTQFAAEGRTFVAPAGWTVTDPVAGKRPEGAIGFCSADPPAGVALARLGGPGGGTSAVLVYGAAADLTKFLDDCMAARKNDALVKFDDEFRTTTSAGTTVNVQLAHVDPATPGGATTSLLLGRALAGDHVFAIDAGAPTATFDRPSVMSLIGSVAF